MHIKNLEIIGFLGRKDPLSIQFNQDINIVTGFNGAGKTNLLKVIWYTISGNITHLIKEVNFTQFTLTTSLYTVHLVKNSVNTCSGWIEVEGKRKELEDLYDDEGSLIRDARDEFSDILKERGGSLFFPTFRRIEGGFTISGDEKPQRGSLNSFLTFNSASNSSDLQKAVVEVAQRLSNKQHSFVTSISTVDISELLMRRYTALSEESAQFQTKTTQEVISEIRTFRMNQASKNSTSENDAGTIIDSIAAKIELIDSRREKTMAPFKAVQDLVGKIFHHKAIQINKRLSFGDAAEAISSDLLSAGEKQMLSFICYNAFFSNIPIFIDEPELSLHVDWQRTLFPTLESQETSNQFIIATHSPFIYSKYPEKEIALVSSRGDEHTDA